MHNYVASYCIIAIHMCACFTGFQQNATGPSSVCLGNDAIFTCRIKFIGDANRTVNARWRRNGINVTITNINCTNRDLTPCHTFIYERNEANQSVVTGLIVNDTTVDDDGAVYTCSPNASNDMNLTSTVMLNITTGTYIVC